MAARKQIMEWIDRLVPPRYRNEAERRQSRLLVSSASVLVVLLTLTLAVRWWLLPVPLGALVLMVSAILLLTIALLLPWLGASIQNACRLVVWTFLLLYASILYPTGGLAAPAAVSAPVAPLLAALLLGRREALRVFGAILLILAVNILFPPPSPWADQPHREIVVRALLIALCTSLVTLFVVVSDRERLETLERLARSRNLYAKLFDQTKDAVILSTSDGQLLDVNQASLDLYQAPDRTTLLHRAALDFYERPAQRERLLEILGQEGYAQAYESRHRTLDGELRIVQGTTSTLRDEVGRVEMLMTILRDVTEPRRLADEREQTLRQLAHKNAELERFATTVSHDLKSPLLTVSGFLGVLRRDLAEGKQQRWPRDLERIEGAVEAMRTLIDDLLSYARLGDRRPVLTAVDLGDILRQVSTLLTGRLNACRARLEIAPDLPTVQGDGTLLRTVFQNLLDNAAKFSATVDGRDRAPRIRVGAQILEGGMAECWVKDNGPGIPAEQLDQVFELFHRLEPKIEGTGVGLASAKRAVDLMGGRLRARSEPGDGPETGATFTVSLPLAAVPGADG